MKYSYSKDIGLSFEEAEINMKDAFKSKLDLDYKNYKILGACNPKLAHEALNSEKLIGILMPCNILIIDNENQTTKIVFPYAKSLLEVTDNIEIFKLADKVDGLLNAAYDSIN